MSTADIATLLEQSRSEDPKLQTEAIRKLVELDARASVPVLVEASRSQDEHVRSAAAEALGRLGAGDAAAAGEALLGLLSDPEDMVRSDAVDALAISITRLPWGGSKRCS
jgi:HEAT repeat protein